MNHELNRERLGSREDWALLAPTQDPLFQQGTSIASFRVGTAGARIRLAAIVNDFLEIGAVRPELWSDGQQWRVYYHSVGNEPLFGDLAIQLVFAVSGVEGFATCSACGSPYIPEMSPRPRQNHFRSAACRKKGWALSSRRYRSSKALAKRLEESTSADEFIERIWPVPPQN